MVQDQTNPSLGQRGTKEALEDSITEAIRLITPDDAKAWFDHCINGLQ
jgi:hypothetical protein